MSALIFSTDLVRLLDEGARCRLPPTYVGVRRVRPDAPNTTNTTNTTTRRREEKGEEGGEEEGDRSPVSSMGGGNTRDDDDGDDCENDAVVAAVGRADDDGECPYPRNARDDDDDDDDGNVVNDDHGARYATGGDGGRATSATASSMAVEAMVYRVIDPESGIERRMTSKEKKEVKYRMKAEARETSREEKRRLHEERIRDAKKGKAERLRCKRMAAAAARRQRTSMEGEMGDADAAETDVRMTTKDDGGCAGATTTRNRDGEREAASSSSDGGDANDNAATSTLNDVTHAANTGGAHDGERREAGGYSSSAVAPNVHNDPPSTVAGGGGRRCLPPAMLAPAATRVAMDLGLLPTPASSSFSSSLLPRHDDFDDIMPMMMTAMDLELSSEWSQILQRSMIPAETSRAGEEMRPMAYRLVPEPWRRLCPDTLWTATLVSSSPPKTRKGADAGGATMGSGRRFAGPEEEMKEEGASASPGGAEEYDSTRRFEGSACAAPACRRSSALVRIRDPSSSSCTYDEDAYAVICHIHRYSRLHVACGAAFGCDFLLYDGRREARHSFAGLRIHSSGSRHRRDGGRDCKIGDRCKSGDKDDDHDGRVDASGTSTEGGVVRFPVPTAYDMSGFVRTMNTVRKMALVAMVVRDRRRSGSGHNATELNTRIAIVDLALEKVLTAHAHIRKGSTTKRRSEEDAASGLARKR